MTTDAVQVKARKQIEIVAGDLTISVEATCLDGKDEIEGELVAKTVRGDVEWDAEELERAAAALRTVRQGLHDGRSVCPAHGYYLLDGSLKYGCPKCQDGPAMKAPALAAVDRP